MHLDTAIAEFVADLQLAGRAHWTIKKHQLELDRLGRWCASAGRAWDQLARRDVQEYARTKAHLGHSSRSNMLCSLRTFYAWAVEQEYMAMSPAAALKTPRRPRPLPRALTLDQVRQLVAHLRSCEGRRARRDQALLLTALYAGLRSCELARIQWADVDLDAGIINIEISKMGKGRSVPIHAELSEQLRTWCIEQAGASSWAVFSLNGAAFKSSRVGKIAARAARASGVKFTAHVMRHTFATWALRRSGNLYAVSKALGHAQVQQTEIYISADPDLLRGAVGSLPALNAW
jgi:integrase/recombinase XerC